MTLEEIVNSEELKTLVSDYRGMCFWNVADDFMPKTYEQVMLALDNVEHYGTLDAYRRVSVIRKWL